MTLNLSNFNFVTNTPCKNVPFVGELLYVLNTIVIISVRACVCMSKCAEVFPISAPLDR